MEGVARYGTNNFIQLEVVAAIVELCVCGLRTCTERPPP